MSFPDGPNSATDICNMALLNLGATDEISNIDEENSDEARSFKRVYTNTLNAMLQRYDWNWATVYAKLGLNEQCPNQAWRFAYNVPADCLFFRRIWNGSHVDTKYNTIRFVKGKLPSGQVIYTDFGQFITPGTTPPPIPDPCLIPLGVYTTKSFTVADMPPMFIDAFAMILSCNIAVKYGGPGASNQREKNMVLADMLWSQAVARDANEIRPPEEYISDIQKSHSLWGVGLGFRNRAGEWVAEPANYTV